MIWNLDILQTSLVWASGTEGESSTSGIDRNSTFLRESYYSSTKVSLERSCFTDFATWINGDALPQHLHYDVWSAKKLTDPPISTESRALLDKLMVFTGIQVIKKGISKIYWNICFWQLNISGDYSELVEKIDNRFFSNRNVCATAQHSKGQHENVWNLRCASELLVR